MMTSLGEKFALAIAAKDHDAVRGLLRPDIDFRAMTPGRVWEADDPDGVVAMLEQWFDDSDHVDAIDALETDRFADRERVGYRLRVHNDDGPHLVEQQAYLTAKDGQIGWMRVMCSGWRRVA